MKSGFIGLIGRPNAGKSTLLNNIIGRKIAITSSKPQTTRNLIQGIYTTDDIQMVFVDTPGIHKPKDKLGQILNRQAYFSLDDVDVILLVVDASEKLGNGDKFIIEKLKEIDKPVILLLNKIDKLTNDMIIKKIEEYKDLYEFSEIIPICSLKQNSITYLIKVLEKYLKDDIKYYDSNTYTNANISFLISEYIREKAIILTREEVPHTLLCTVDDIKFNKNVVNINATIVVDKESVKRIIVGHNGSMIKKIGTLARYDIEELLGKKVYLELFVKVIDNWRDKNNFLNENGFQDFNCE